MNKSRLVIYTKQRLIKEKVAGNIAAISANGCVVRFVLKQDIDKECYLGMSGVIRRFPSDIKALLVVRQIEEVAENKLIGMGE